MNAWAPGSLVGATDPLAVTTDILASYRSPGTVLRRLAAGPEHEGRLLAYLMLGCLMIFVAQLPRLSRDAALDPSADITERASGELLFWMLIAPLIFYGLAALSRWIAKLFSGRGTWYTARLALFWAVLAAAPLWLLRGMVAGFIGPGFPLDVVGLIALVGFGIIWVAGLRTMEQGDRAGSNPIAQTDEVT